MDGYQIGKDIGELMARVAALEQRVLPCDCSASDDQVAILASCNRRKEEVNEKYVYTKFGQCNHLTDDLAKVEANALLLLLQAENPGCPDSKADTASVSGAAGTRYLAYAACKLK